MNGHVQICKLCKKPKRYSAFYICQECLVELDKVSMFIKKNPQASIAEISYGINLPSDCVQRIIEFFLGPNKQIKQ
ncbi:hypothetical protein [Ornithinibacillus scapharcae]|uniref:hypothetical protein n=1 Tax=Ornithinibacillus scapharcae TaxID=1147159 RepID=UPI000225AA60|nr:hypothetical protein [Ornithinibacillus scapharcae]